MEAELALLAQGAGVTLVTLMTTDAWERAREGFIRLWQQFQPQRTEAITAELETSREELLTARTTGDEQTLHELRSQWQGQLRRLLAAQPNAVEELRGLLEELSPSGTADHPTTTQHGTASGHGRIYQAGRDQHINER